MQPFTRRGFLGLSGAVAAGAALTACAGTSSTSSSSSSGGGDASTITFWSSHPGSSKDIENELISRFQTANPDLTVQMVDGGKNYEEIAQKMGCPIGTVRSRLSRAREQLKRQMDPFA